MFLKRGKGGGGGNLKLKGGEYSMDEPTIAMEVERVMNLTSGFGWEKVKEEIVEDEIHITLKKKTHAPIYEGAE
jgi:hypothetical protein